MQGGSTISLKWTLQDRCDRTVQVWGILQGGRVCIDARFYEIRRMYAVWIVQGGVCV
jgi:hypothetical protein